MSLCDQSVVRQEKSSRMLIISQVLLQHTGSVRKFTLSLYRDRSSDINCFLRFVCNNAMKDFNVDFLMCERYKMGAPIFSCTQLVNLYLGCCIFRPPPGFSGFGKLTSLKFCNVKITGDMHSNMISSCPRLEKLSLEMLTSCGHLDIVGPNLRFFLWEGEFIALCFKDTSMLETLPISLVEFPQQSRAAAEDAEEKIFAAFDVVPALKNVELTSSFLKYIIWGTVPDRFQNDLSHLEAIKLHGVSFDDIDEAKGVLYLLRSSTNLEKITIDVMSNAAGWEPALEVLKTGGLTNLTLNKLREVVMVRVIGKRSELLLIEILLAKAPALEKMVIELFILLTREDRSSILGEVMQFQRASPRAYIKYSHPLYDEEIS